MRRLTNYFLRHSQAVVNSLGQLSRVPLASFMTCLIIGIALSFPTILFVALKNFENIGTNLQKTAEILVYLKPGTKTASVNELVQRLQTNSFIENVKIISPEKGLEELQQQAGFKGDFVTLSENPLPWTLIVIPRPPDMLEHIAQTIQSMPEVSSLQFDKLWLERLSTIIILVHRVAYALTLFLGIAVFLLINNIIRSATQQNYREIKLIKLIGGTDSFIRRPFLYAGLIYGLLGGIIAWQLVDLLLILLKGPIAHLTELYGSSFQLSGVGLYNTLILLGSSMGLGLLGSWWATTRYLLRSPVETF